MMLSETRIYYITSYILLGLCHVLRHPARVLLLAWPHKVSLTALSPRHTLTGFSPPPIQVIRIFSRSF